MLLDEIKNIKSGKKELREFGVTVGIVFGLLSGLLWWRHKDNYVCFFVLSLVLIISGLAMPIILKPIQKVWMAIAVIIGAIMTRVILCFLFYIVITPIGLLRKMSGKDVMNLQFNKSLDSYWIPRKKEAVNKASYEKQF